MSKAKAADLDLFLAKSLKRNWADLSPSAVADLKHLAEHAKNGRPMGWEAMRQWFRTRHNVNPGRTRLATIAREHGLTPWWSNGSSQ